MADLPRRSKRVAKLINKFDLTPTSSTSSHTFLGFTDSLTSVYEDQNSKMSSTASASSATQGNVQDRDNNTNVNGLVTAQLIAALQSPEVTASNFSLVDRAVKMALDDHYNKHYKPLNDKCKELQRRVSELEGQQQNCAVLEKRVADLESRMTEENTATKQLIQDEKSRTMQSETM